MIIKGGINFIENGLTANLRAMHLQTEMLGIHNDNIVGFDKIGYQRKDVVVSSFTEFIGAHGLSTALDDSVGRIMVSDNPLDIVIANKGYFQTSSAEGKKMTRDGRFKINKEGDLLTLEDNKVISNDGLPIKLHVVPEKLSDIKIDTEGNVSVFNKKNGKLEYVATLAVVTNEGIAVLDPNIKQGYNEYSNVSLSDEFLQLIPIRRKFEANRQLFIIQNNNLSKAISELGRA